MKDAFIINLLYPVFELWVCELNFASLAGHAKRMSLQDKHTNAVHEEKLQWMRNFLIINLTLLILLYIHVVYNCFFSLNKF